jgi:hypothetical protein
VQAWLTHKVTPHRYGHNGRAGGSTAQPGIASATQPALLAPSARHISPSTAVAAAVAPASFLL